MKNIKTFKIFMNEGKTFNGESFETLRKQLETATEKYHEALRKAPPGMNPQQFFAYAEKAGNEMEYLSRQVRMIQPFEMEPIPSYGDVMSLEDFKEDVKAGNFTDDDGSGNYARGNQMSDVSIYPSDVDEDMVRNDFDKVVWFNK